MASNPPVTHIQFNESSFQDPTAPVSDGMSNDTSRHTHTDALENGDVEKDESRLKFAGNADEGDEYTRLVRYISTYNEGGRRKSTASQLEQAGVKKKPWWAFWRKGPKVENTSTGDFEVPDEWLESDIRQGISNTEVELRRKKTGFNELTTEKVNPFLQFLSYFQGPILYGTFRGRRARCLWNRKTDLFV